MHNETLWDTIARYLYEDWCRGTSASCIQVAPKPSGPVGRVALEGRIGSGWEGVFLLLSYSCERHNSATAVCRDEVLIYVLCFTC